MTLKNRFAACCFAAAMLHTAFAAAQTTAGPVDLEALQWTTLPNGAKVAVFMGNPKEAGPYGSRARLPANWRVAPHTHPEEGRVTTVVSGVFYWAIGEQFDEAKLKAFGPGSVIIESKGVPHYAMTKQEGTEIQTTSMGPADMQYIEPGK
jgi:quercetin dioxygenase-like cupin family protein